MKNDYEIIIRPIITEKTSTSAEQLVYTFEVDKRANKVEIKNAVEQIFNVKVVDVRTVTVRQKPRRMQRFTGFDAGYKKAIIRLVPGQKIDAFEI